MNTLVQLPARPADPLHKAAAAGVAVWLDHRHTPASAPAPRTDTGTEEGVRGHLLPGTPALRPGAGPADLLAASAGGRAATVGPVLSLAGYRRAMDTVLTALEAAVTEGVPLPARPVAIECSLPGIDTAVNAHLDLAGSWEAKAMRGLAALAAAQLLYAALERDLGTERWSRLAVRGARAPYLLWSTTGFSVTADRSVHYAERCLFPGTAVALAPDALRRFRERGVVLGPTALDTAEAQRVADTLGWFGVRLGADGD
ncbi:hypothetical protein ACFRMQ_02825 [Kitasatospora sp. NPDC056783]|uniref:hypothetical protein n=1 Tax=Kitasatospora sp. NPDC056783 TaxID=3345943 RepID=UPI0036B9D42A